MASLSTKIISWNANGVRNKAVELHNLLESQKAEVCLIQETHLGSALTFKLPNYTIYRTDRPGALDHKKGGGVALAIKVGTKHTEIVIPPLKTVEAVGVEVHAPAGTIRLISVYLPPKKTLHPEDLEALADSTKATIIAGDLNAKHVNWNSKSTNAKGRVLMRHSLANDLTVVGPKDPTHYSGRSKHFHGDVLDIAILSGVRRSVCLETLTALTSDHNPILIEYGDEMTCEPPAERLNYAKADWKLFQATLAETTVAEIPSSREGIDKAVQNLTGNIQAAIKKAVPVLKARRNDLYDLPPAIIKAIAIKNKARRDYQRFRTSDTKKRYNALCRQLKELIGEHRGDKWDKAVESLNIQDKSVYRMARALQRQKQPNLPIQAPDHLAVDNKDKAEVFANSLEQQFTNSAKSPLTNIVNEALHLMRTHAPAGSHGEQAVLCNLEEVGKLVDKLKPRKAPGSDGITNQVIQELPSQAANQIVTIFNACLKLQYFPQAWQEAKIILFPKPGKNLRLPDNHRPISLLSNLAKLLERVILARLNKHLTDNNILINEQYGFRSEHSTTQQLLRVVNKITHGYNTNNSTAVVFLDVAKAFDQVWHEGTVFKLISINCPMYLTTLLDGYLTNRTFRVAVKDELSALHPIRAGVPQGSVLGPLLFNVFTNDIPKQLHKTELALYADDAAIMSSSWQVSEIEKNMQTALDRLLLWYREWRITINTDKTAATLFTRKTKQKTPELVAEAKPIIFSEANKYLGLILDAKLTWQPQTTAVHTKAMGKLAALRPLFASKTMRPLTKVHLYKQIIRPTITYACPIWTKNLGKSARNRLQVLQNRTLRQAFQASITTRLSSLHDEGRIEILETHMDKLTTQFYDKLKDSPNQLTRHQTSFTTNPFDKYPRPLG